MGHLGNRSSFVSRFMRQDSRKYSHPQAFDPERFMGPEPELDPRTYVFGFGRRICPGQYICIMWRSVGCSG